MTNRLKLIEKLEKEKFKPVRVIMGDGCTIHPTAIIGKDGFGYEWDGEGYRFFPHKGNVIIGSNVSIGAHTCIDRGNLSDTEIGYGTKIDNLVHIAHNVKIGQNCLIVAGSVICGSTVIGDKTYIGAGVTIREHLVIGSNVFIGMGSVVTKNIPDGEMWYGNPAKFAKENK